MRRWRKATAVVLVLTACQQVKKLPLIQAPAAGPQSRATVVTINTAAQPSKRTSTHTIIIGPSLARSTDEIVTWRLFDFKQNRVTFVDDHEKTYRTETLRTLVDRRQDALDVPLVLDLPAAQLAVTNEQRQLLGVTATQTLIRLGGYSRALWMAAHPQIPPNLFALMNASTPPFSPLAGIARNTDAALLAMEGFPLAEHSEIVYAKTTLIVDRNVVSVEQKDVPAALLEIPPGYRELPSISAQRQARPRQPVTPLQPATETTELSPATSTETTSATPVTPTTTIVPTTTVLPVPVETSTSGTAVPTSTALSETASATTAAERPAQQKASSTKTKALSTTRKAATTKTAPAKKTVTAKKSAAKKPVVKKAPAVTKKPATTKKPPARKKAPATKKTATTKSAAWMAHLPFREDDHEAYAA